MSAFGVDGLGQRAPAREQRRAGDADASRRPGRAASRVEPVDFVGQVRASPACARTRPTPGAARCGMTDADRSHDGATTSGAKNTNAAATTSAGDVAEHAAAARDVEVHAFEAELEPCAYVAGSVMNAASDRDDDVARIVRGLFGRDAHVSRSVGPLATCSLDRKNGFAGRRRRARRPRSAIRRARRSSAASVASALFAYTASSSSASGFTHTATTSTSVVGLASCDHALAQRGDHARRDAGLRRAPRELRVALVRSPSTVALLTNSVIGFTGTFGCTTTTNGVWPAAASRARSPTPRRPGRPWARAPC